jgi:preprotein translocase subunit SecF
LGGKLGTGGVAAFLMLIGYSVDTDILLSTRVLKHGHGTIFQRCIDAMKTGMTMSITTIAAVTVGLIFSQSEVLKQIFTILLIGLIIDIIMTWLQNTAILRWYLEPKKPKTETVEQNTEEKQ